MVTVFSIASVGLLAPRLPLLPLSPTVPTALLNPRSPRPLTPYCDTPEPQTLYAMIRYPKAPAPEPDHNSAEQAKAPAWLVALRIGAAKEVRVGFAPRAAVKYGLRGLDGGF